MESTFEGIFIESVGKGILFMDDAIESFVDAVLSTFGVGRSVALYGVLQAANADNTITTKKILSFI